MIRPVHRFLSIGLSTAMLAALGTAIVGADIAAAVEPSAGKACDISWTGAGTVQGSWSDPGNWSRNGLTGVPQFGDIVCVSAGKGVVMVDTDTSVGAIYVDSGSELFLGGANGGGLHLDNAGLISVVSKLTVSGSSSTIVLDGVAPIHVTESFGWTGSRMAGAGALVLDAGSVGTIAGSFLQLLRPIVNKGALTITSSAADPLGSDVSLIMTGNPGDTPGSLTNEGSLTLEASRGALYVGDRAAAIWYHEIATTAGSTLHVVGPYDAHLQAVTTLDGSWSIDPGVRMWFGESDAITMGATVDLGAGAILQPSKAPALHLTGAVSGHGIVCPFLLSTLRLDNPSALSGVDRVDIGVCNDVVGSGGSGLSVPRGSVASIKRLSTVSGATFDGGGTVEVVGDSAPDTVDLDLGDINIQDATLTLGPAASGAFRGVGQSTKSLSTPPPSAPANATSSFVNHGDLVWLASNFYTDSSTSFINAADGTITFSPSGAAAQWILGTGHGTIVNDGHLVVMSGTLLLDGRADSGPLGGIIDVAAGATLAAYAASITGTLRIAGASATLPGGQLAQQVGAYSDLTNSGHIELGAGALVHASMNYVQTAAASLKVDIAGPNDTEHGLVTASYSTMLDGHLDAVGVRPFATPAAPIDVVRAAGLAGGILRTGTFASVTGSGRAGALWDAVYSDTAASVSIVDTIDTGRVVTITPSAPSAVAGGAPLAVDVLETDSVGGLVVGELVTLSASGSAVVTDASGALAPALTDANGVAHFLVSDPIAQVVTLSVPGSIATASVTFTAVNHSPVGVDDTYTTRPGQPLTVAAPGVLGNDSDPDGDPLRVVAFGSGSHGGQLSMAADGSFAYSAVAGFVGDELFTVFVSDGFSVAVPETLTVSTVNHSPVGVDDTYTTRPGQPLTVAAPGVLGNDSDPDGDPLRVVAFGSGSHGGQLSMAADGSFAYSAVAGFVGDELFTVFVSDGFSVAVPETLTVSTVNHSPVGVDDTYTTRPGQPLTVAAPGVLGNDSDPDGDPLRVVAFGSGSHGGQLSMAADGSFAYSAVAGFVGDELFTVFVSDGFSVAVPETLTVSTVNHSPVGVDDTYTTRPGQPLTVAAPGVLGNDSDPDGDPLRVVAFGSGSHGGQLSMAADGSFAYSAVAGFVGDELFTVFVSDGFSVAVPETLTITTAFAYPVTLTITPSVTVAPTGSTISVTVHAVDANGSIVPNYPVSLATDHGAVLTSTTTTTDANGDAHYTLTNTTAGITNLTIAASATNNSAAAFVTFTPRVADLSLGLTAGTFHTGSAGVLTLTVTNIGGTATTGPLLVIATLPTGYSRPAVSAPAGWTCLVLGRALVCLSTRPIAPGATATVTVSGTVAAVRNATVSATATVVMLATDPTPANNSRTISLPVV